jgi:hypothetical protein
MTVAVEVDEADAIVFAVSGEQGHTFWEFLEHGVRELGETLGVVGFDRDDAEDRKGTKDRTHGRTERSVFAVLHCSRRWSKAFRRSPSKLQGFSSCTPASIGWALHRFAIIMGWRW